MERWTTEARTFHSFLLMSQLDPGAIRSRIREARKAAGLTQEQLAELLEVHKRTVENYENNRTPDYTALNQLGRVLNRPVEWFLYGDEVINRAERQQEDSEAITLLRQVIERQDRMEKRQETGLDLLQSVVGAAAAISDQIRLLLPSRPEQTRSERGRVGRGEQ